MEGGGGGGGGVHQIVEACELSNIIHVLVNGVVCGRR